MTVLVPPSAPQINPVNPVAVEGQPSELVCSSVGGSPDPVLRWYRKGEASPLDAPVKAGGSRSVATTATLTLQPQKEDDGAEYRCVAWNRALDANDKKEANVVLTVNCKSIVFAVLFALVVAVAVAAPIAVTGSHLIVPFLFHRCSVEGSANCFSLFLLFLFLFQTDKNNQQ